MLVFSLCLQYYFMLTDYGTLILFFRLKYGSISLNFFYQLLPQFSQRIGRL